MRKAITSSNPIRRKCAEVLKYHFFMFCCFGPVVFYCMDIKTHIFFCRYYHIISWLEHLYHMTSVLIWFKAKLDLHIRTYVWFGLALFDSKRRFLIDTDLGFRQLNLLMKENEMRLMSSWKKIFFRKYNLINDSNYWTPRWWSK